MVDISRRTAIKGGVATVLGVAGIKTLDKSNTEARDDEERQRRCPPQGGGR